MDLFIENVQKHKPVDCVDDKVRKIYELIQQFLFNVLNVRKKYEAKLMNLANKLIRQLDNLRLARRLHINGQINDKEFQKFIFIAKNIKFIRVLGKVAFLAPFGRPSAIKRK